MILHQSVDHADRRSIVSEGTTESGKHVLVGFGPAHDTTKPDQGTAIEPEMDLLTLGVRPAYRHHQIAHDLIMAMTISLIDTCQIKGSEQSALVHAVVMWVAHC